mmetsp:Transcript_1755/g.4440  ORF Transcript_1755/g.4440 Transcript_1755/m.4440 type:complete len:359 (-) Transcript_1755:645-1721(-)
MHTYVRRRAVRWGQGQGRRAGREGAQQMTQPPPRFFISRSKRAASASAASLLASSLTLSSSSSLLAEEEEEDSSRRSTRARSREKRCRAVSREPLSASCRAAGRRDGLPAPTGAASGGQKPSTRLRTSRKVCCSSLQPWHSGEARMLCSATWSATSTSRGRITSLPPVSLSASRNMARAVSLAAVACAVGATASRTSVSGRTSADVHSSAVLLQSSDRSRWRLDTIVSFSSSLDLISRSSAGALSPVSRMWRSNSSLRSRILRAQYSNFSLCTATYALIATLKSSMQWMSPRCELRMPSTRFLLERVTESFACPASAVVDQRMRCTVSSNSCRAVVTFATLASQSTRSRLSWARLSVS